MSRDHQCIEEGRATGRCTPYEKEYLRQDGTRIPVLVGTVFLGATRQSTIAFILDLTERKQLEQTLRQQTEALQHANRLKDEFLAVLSHELRTPLNPILGWTQMLKTRKMNPEKTAQALTIIERNVKLQTHLIDDLLDVSRILQGKLSLNIQPVDLVSIVKSAIETVHLAAQAKSIALNFFVVDDSRCTVLGGWRSPPASLLECPF
ncbi:MAG: hypothetical protein HC936_18845 [Leptolyngbyaceae cyanobacterium SU_3_3]|nr:hypothetical protein [Leptolyngbyaceae cyanobacterium SU_3_3]